MRLLWSSEYSDLQIDDDWFEADKSADMTDSKVQRLEQ